LDAGSIPAASTTFYIWDLGTGIWDFKSQFQISNFKFQISNLKFSIAPAHSPAFLFCTACFASLRLCLNTSFGVQRVIIFSQRREAHRNRNDCSHPSSKNFDGVNRGA